MQSKKIGIGLIIVGVLIIAAIFLAVAIHLSGPVIGLNKTIALVIGGIAVVAGLILVMMKGQNPK